MEKPDRAEFKKVHESLCNKSSWIIEGMAIRHLDYRTKKADVIIFLDIPLWVCLYRIFKRAISGYGKVRDSSATGCPEHMPNKEFLSYVWSFGLERTYLIEECLYQNNNKKRFLLFKIIKSLLSLLKSLSF